MPMTAGAQAGRHWVLAQPGSRYAARRARLFADSVNCTEPGSRNWRCCAMTTVKRSVPPPALVKLGNPLVRIRSGRG
jgi:hypothetical protein